MRKHILINKSKRYWYICLILLVESIRLFNYGTYVFPVPVALILGLILSLEIARKATILFFTIYMALAVFLIFPLFTLPGEEILPSVTGSARMILFLLIEVILTLTIWLIRKPLKEVKVIK